MSRSVGGKSLPLDFMGFFALCGLETDKRIRNRAKNCLTFDVNKRKDYVKSIMLPAGGGVADAVSNNLDRILPDYLLVFAVPLLAHTPEFDDSEDVEQLKKLQAGESIFGD